MRLLLALLLAAILPLAARAEEGPARLYALGKVGAYVPTSTDLVGVGTGLAVELAGGWKALPGLALELSIGRLGANGNTTVNRADLGSVPVALDLWSVPITASARASGTLGRVELYLAAGGGIAVTSTVADTTTPGAPAHLTARVVKPAWTGQAGLALPISDVSALGLELKGLYTTATAYGTSIRIDGLLATVTMSMRL